jgi:hypothetical protein
MGRRGGVCGCVFADGGVWMCVIGVVCCVSG